LHLLFLIRPLLLPHIAYHGFTNLITPSRDLFTLVIIEHSYIRLTVVPDSSTIFKAESSPFRMIFIGVNPSAFAWSQEVRRKGE